MMNDFIIVVCFVISEDSVLLIVRLLLQLYSEYFPANLTSPCKFNHLLELTSVCFLIIDLHDFTCCTGCFMSVTAVIREDA